jgi:two-component system, cell cycle sensor histidine kinase and response regulator CckA
MHRGEAGRRTRFLAAALQPRGYLPGLIAFAIAFAIHIAVLKWVAVLAAFVIALYLLVLVYSAWHGYGPGILAVVLVLTVVPYFTRANWQPSKTNWRVVAALVLLDVCVSFASNYRLKVEDALRRTNVELDERVRRRTAELETANRQLEDRAAEIEALYRKLSVGVCFLDRELRFVRVNEALAALNGIPLADHAGRRLRDAVSPEVADVLEPLYRRVMDTGEPLIDFELTGPRRGGGPNLDRLIGATPVQTDGKVVGIQAIVQDVTERRRFDEKLRHTAKLESLGVLAGGIAHDFNNLLTGILGNASLAQDIASQDPQLTALLGDVVRASERAAELTQQLLAYAGKGRFTVETVDVSALVNESHPLVEASVAKRARVQLELAPNCYVSADPSQLQQIVMNLIINAAEAIPEGRLGTVTVRTREVQIDDGWLRSHRLFGGEQVAPGPHVCLEVQDDGSGMEQATLDRIFDPFFTTKFTGRGLGLAAVLGIVRGHRGGLAVESAFGRGTTFRIFLPHAGSAPRAKGQHAAPAVAKSDRYVLIVDDEEVVRRTARAGLENYGYRVLLASSGQEAVSLLERHDVGIGLVVLDLTMPGMDGAATFRALRKLRPDLTVILSSGYDEADVASRFHGERFAGFIKKPYTAAALAHKVSAVALEAV